ncbi:MAG: hypothetical protein RL037_2075 [Bacteroidota bacterium]|jgi:glycerophosphoryl diester phosphodiesterase
MKKTILVFTCSLFIFPVFSQVEYFGHRGARGLLPENSIPSFKKALEFPISGIEWDVVVNKDNELVISHEPYFKTSICQSNSIDDDELKTYNIYHMSQQEIEGIDCGLKKTKSFPNQQKISTSKPTFKQVQQEIKFGNRTILFEIKSEEKEYGISQPFPQKFATLILEEIEASGLRENIIFMSFDATILNEIYAKDSSLRLIYLTYKPLVSINKFLSVCTFKPYALGMFYRTISRKKIDALHKKEIKSFAWTVNNKKQAAGLIKIGVDGIITDYPDRINHALITP